MEIIAKFFFVLAICEIAFLFGVIIKILIDLLGEDSDAWYWRGAYLMTLPPEEQEHSDDI